TRLQTTDWQNVAYRSAPIQNHELRISGSTEDTRLMFSANWYDQQAVLLGSDVTRGSLRFNLDQNVGARFRLGARATYSRTAATHPALGPVVHRQRLSRAAIHVAPAAGRAQPGTGERQQQHGDHLALGEHGDVASHAREEARLHPGGRMVGAADRQHRQ